MNISGNVGRDSLKLRNAALPVSNHNNNLSEAMRKHRKQNASQNQLNLSQVITLGNPFRMERALALNSNSPKVAADGSIDSHGGKFSSDLVSEKTESDNLASPANQRNNIVSKAVYTPNTIK